MTLDLDRLEELLAKANSQPPWGSLAYHDLMDALHAAAPELLRRARRADALEEAIVRLNDGYLYSSPAVLSVADQIEKERKHG